MLFKGFLAKIQNQLQKRRINFNYKMKKPTPDLVFLLFKLQHCDQREKIFGQWSQIMHQLSLNGNLQARDPPILRPVLLQTDYHHCNLFSNISQMALTDNVKIELSTYKESIP